LANDVAGSENVKRALMNKVTLADILHIDPQARIRLTCQSCRRTLILSAHELADQWGPHLRLDRIKARGRCTACGSTEIDCQPEHNHTEK
jgi:hypothetical protein